MSMSVKVGVAGATGYAGGELLRLLLVHPEVEIGAVTAGSSAGSRLGEHQPHLRPLADRVVEVTTPEAFAGHDVVFLALPHGASAELAMALPDDTTVIDCGADFRLTDADDWQKFYGTDHAGSWPYGLPELPGQRDLLRGATRIALPGCNVTAATMALFPAIRAGLIDGHDITVTGAVGPSGAGKAVKPHLLGSELIGSATPYGVGGVHRHTPEMVQNLRAVGATDPSVSFTPILVPMSRGILVSCTAPLVDPATDGATVRVAYEEAFADEPFVDLLPDGQWPQTQWVTGSNNCLVQTTVDPSVGRLIALAVLDNLTKGTAGQGIQALNLARGFDEKLGLTMMGVAP